MNSNLIYRDGHLISIWLPVCIVLVVAMVMIGGYTRLSGSGLSITEWKPIHGVIPPLSATEWEEEFAGYKRIPQYAAMNAGMTLGDFKTIYWPEYFHRLIGRLIGFWVLIPLLIFIARRSISREFAWRMAGIIALGGLQGVIGWYMVSSGLSQNTHVSHLRLALHLSVAFAILGALVWTWLEVSGCGSGVAGSVNQKQHLLPLPTTHNPKPAFLIWFFLLCLQIIFGAFTAGLHAGLVYNSWPDMNGQFLPPELTQSGNWLENPILVQFIHRSLAIFVACGFPLWWFLHRRYVSNNGLNPYCVGVITAIAVQFVLGVLTLVNVVPLHLALLHQLGAVVLFGAAVILMYELVNGLRKNI